MEQVKTTLLIVEDDLDIADMLNAYFGVQGYAVQTVNWGDDAIRACQSQVPDLVVLDIRLPDMDGFEVARKLRANRKTRHIPIIFLTEKRERADRLRGLELHADDYITKPFDIQELRLRVRNALRRANQSTLTNPVTGLPEGGLVDEALAESLEGAEGSLMIVSLKNLNRFREVYGFVASDDLLRAVSLMLRDSLRSLCEPDAFLGHLTASDFLIISRAGPSAALRDQIRKRLEQSFHFFYSDQDREQGTFRDRCLGVQFNDLHIGALQSRDIAHLKAELAQFCH